MAKLHAATAPDQLLLAGHREMPLLTVVAEGEVHVVFLYSDGTFMTEVPCVAEGAAVCAFFERLLADARQMDCENQRCKKRGRE